MMGYLKFTALPGFLKKKYLIGSWYTVYDDTTLVSCMKKGYNNEKHYQRVKKEFNIFEISSTYKLMYIIY